MDFKIGELVKYKENIEAIIINIYYARRSRERSITLLTLETNNKVFVSSQNSITKLIKKNIPDVFFTVGRMNPPTPGHVNGLLMQLIEKVVERIKENIENHNDLIESIINSQKDDLTNFKKQYVKFTNQYNEDVQELNRHNMSKIGGAATAVAEQFVQQFVDKSKHNIGIREYHTKLSQFIMKYSSYANVYCKIFITATSNKTRYNRLLEYLASDKDAVPSGKYLENPLTLEEKYYFINKMLLNIGFTEDFLENIFSYWDKHCFVFGIKSAIRCALQLQIRKSGYLDPTKIYYVVADDSQTNKSDNRSKFCIESNKPNDEPPKVNCEDIDRVDNISATMIRTPFLTANTIEDGIENIREIYADYLNPEDQTCLYTILIDRLAIYGDLHEALNNYKSYLCVPKLISRHLTRRLAQHRNSLHDVDEVAIVERELQKAQDDEAAGAEAADTLTAAEIAQATDERLDEAEYNEVKAQAKQQNITRGGTKKRKKNKKTHSKNPKKSKRLKPKKTKKITFLNVNTI